MKKFNFQKALPHLIAVITFLLLSIYLTKPALEGRVVQQHDVIQWKAMAQQSFEFEKKYGHLPKWTNSLFSGMPAYQIAMGPEKPMYIHPYYIQDVLTLGLPRPVYYLFLASLCFYLLSLVMGVNAWIGIIGGIAYGYCSYNPVLIVAGHDTKLMSMAYAPAVIAGLQLIFNKKYWLGSALLLLSGIFMMSQSHQQIVYYTLLIVIFMAIAFAIKCIRKKEFRHLGISAGLSIILGAVMLGTMALSYGPTYEFSKETMRGGRSELTKADKKFETSGGLDKDYAFQWSYGKAETMTLLVPNAVGGSSAEGLGEESKAIGILQENAQSLQGMANQIAQASPMYWGELLNTSGTVYMGAIICLLFLFGAFLSKSEHRWWLVAITLFGIVLAWGKNLESVNYFLFDHLPFYKKFRAPSMALVIPQLSIALLAVIFIDEFIKQHDAEKMKKLLKSCLIITGSTIAAMGLFYFMADFSNTATSDLRKNVTEAMQGQNSEFVRSYFSALKEDRQSFYLSDMMRSLGFIVLTIAVIFLYAKKIIKPAIVYAVLIVFTAIDLVGVSKRYLKDENFIEPADYENAFADSRADVQIKKDSSFYRVLNLAFPGGNGYQLSVGNSFEDAMASYKHNTIGGYNPAKLGLYQDLREKQLYKNIQAWMTNQVLKDSFPVLNMLNMKYVIVPDQRDQRQTEALLNPFALGNCWLVPEIKMVKNADEEMKSLDSFDPAKVAIMDERFKSSILFQPAYDSTATIKLVQNRNDEVSYDFNSSSNQFAVFSEVYYPHGWNAYIDGKPSPYCKVNYVLRGMSIPAGKHKIEFRFEPASVKNGETIARYSNMLAVLVLLFCLFMAWKGQRKPKPTEP